MLRVVGDIHGKFWQYLKIVKDAPNSLQIGDFGWRDSYTLLNKHLDANKHKVILGNHEDYDYIDEFGLPHSLGDFGVATINGVSFFFLRGAFSIDVKPRLAHYYKSGVKTWFQQEELWPERLDVAIAEYKTVKPDIVITHDTPQVVSEMVGRPEVLKRFGFEVPLKTRTQMALQVMLDYHQPSEWIFGHYHRSWNRRVDNTSFRCLDELEYIDI